MKIISKIRFKYQLTCFECFEVDLIPTNQVIAIEMNRVLKPEDHFCPQFEFISSDVKNGNHNSFI